MKMPRELPQASAILLLLSALLLVAPSAAEPGTRDEAAGDLVALESVAVPSHQRAQSVAAGRRYGYPYLVAPTPPPLHAKHVEDNEAVQPKLQSKPYADDTPLKKSKKKQKLAVAERRFSSAGDSSEEDTERPQRRYREPSYRNLLELESIFQPRRIDPGYGYRQKVSPRDPFLSPSAEYQDIFYPTSHKYKKPSYSSGGVRIGYGAGAYDGPYDGPYDSPPPSYGSTYDSPPPSSHGSTYDSPPPSSHGYRPPPPSSNQGYDYNESYSIESNRPIVGDIRKRLLDFAGASDLYEGEPDYLREVRDNRNKYGSIGNNYHPYGGPGNDFRDFHYAASGLVRRAIGAR